MKFELGTFNRNVTDEELLQDLVATDAKIKEQGKKLTFRSYNEFGKYSASTIGVRFGTWNDGVRSAGLAPSEERNVHIEVLFDNLKLVWIAKGKQPVYRDMSAPPSKYTASIYNDRFGGWRKALEDFVLKRDRFCCVSCGQSPATVAGLVLEIDHKLAWSKGGETIEENLQTLCFDCNRGKGASL
jgi:hypothetical protein